MNEEDGRIVARWAFVQGVLHVTVQNGNCRMKVKETYAELVKFMELKGEGHGKQLRRNWATKDINHFTFGRERLPKSVVAKSEEEKKAVAKVLTLVKTKSFGQNATVLEPSQIKLWIEEIKAACSAHGRGDDGELMLYVAVANMSSYWQDRLSNNWAV